MSRVLSLSTRTPIYDPDGYEVSQPQAPTVRFKRLTPTAKLPERMTEGAACFDLFTDEQAILSNMTERRVISTGIGVEIPAGYVGLVCSRIGLAAKRGLFVLNSPGIIDADYRGEIKVILARLELNSEWSDLVADVVSKGDRIAQLMILPLPQLAVEEVTELSTTARGEGGLGSTGT